MIAIYILTAIVVLGILAWIVILCTGLVRLGISSITRSSHKRYNRGNFINIHSQYNKNIRYSNRIHYRR